MQKVRLEEKEESGNNVILSSSVLVFAVHSRFEGSLVIGVLVQKLQNLHQTLDVPKRTQTQESH